MMKRLVLACLLTGLLCQYGVASNSIANNLWAGISSEQPLYKEEDNRNVVIRFALFNDGGDDVFPQVENSHLYINGKKIETLRFSDDSFKPLAPFGELSFSVGLAASILSQPGLYKIFWEGEGFRSSTIEVRILPRERPNKPRAEQTRIQQGL